MYRFMRELPYGYDVLLENIMDPAHVDFAHHGVPGQGDRNNKAVRRMTLVEKAKCHSGCKVHVSAAEAGAMSSSSPVVMQADFSPPTSVRWVRNA